MKTVPSLATLVLGLVAAVGCGSGSAGAEVGNIKVGVIQPLTGGSASAGADVLHGDELARDVLNDRDRSKFPNVNLPRLTVKGQIVLDTGDSQGNPQVGTSEADRLVTTDHAVALTGAYNSGVTQTASQEAERLQVPFVNGASSSAALTERGLKYFFRTGPSDKTFASTYVRWLKSTSRDHPVKRTIVFHTNDAFGNDGATTIKAVMPANGIDVTDDISFQPGTADLTSQVQKLRGDSPDAVWVLAAGAGDSITFVKTLAQLGYTPPAICAFGGGFSLPDYISGLGKAADYTITRAAWSAEAGQKNATVKTVAGLYESRYGKPMTENSAREFTALMTIGMAINAAQSTDPDKIRQALAGLDVKAGDTIMPWDGIKFDDHNQNQYATGVIEQLKDGQYHVLYPAQEATAQVVWPQPALTNR